MGIHLLFNAIPKHKTNYYKSSQYNHDNVLFFFKSGADKEWDLVNSVESDPEDLQDNQLSHPQTNVEGIGAPFKVRSPLFTGTSMPIQKLPLLHSDLF